MPLEIWESLAHVLASLIEFLSTCLGTKSELDVHQWVLWQVESG